MSVLQELVKRDNWSFSMVGGVWRYKPEFTDPIEAAAELAAMQARIEKLETEQTRLNKIIHAVEVASRRKLKSGETVYNIISAVQDALESK